MCIRDRLEQGLAHERSGEVMLISTANSWQAYYWWTDDDRAPEYARAVDIHNKPGYDPVELCFDMATMSVPLDATLIKGSHGAGKNGQDNFGLLISSMAGLSGAINDTAVFEIVLNHFRS